MYTRTFFVLICFAIHSLSFGAIDEDKVARHIDQLIANQLKGKQLKANPKISDQTFLRRAYLDIVGRIPTATEYEQFMNSEASTRRTKLINHLFESNGYVSHSFNYWADTLRATHKLKKTTGSPYLHWIKKSLESNKPYDQFVHELLTAEGPLFKTGNGAVGYYIRDFAMPLDNMANTMQVFLATSMVCAQCHDHPYKKWSQMDFYKLAAFTHGTLINVKGLDKEFVKTVKKSGLNTSGREGPTRGFEKEMRPFYQGTYNSGTGKIKLPADYDYDDAKPHQEIEAGVPYGPEVKIDYTSDNGARKRIYSFRKGDEVKNVNGRKFLADWVTSPENPMFTKTIVNRLWDRMMGVPLVGALTDMKESHLGTNPKLTEFLIGLMKKVKYDQKQFMRIIAKTQSYQRETSKNVTGKYYFTGPVIKRLSAEQVWDSLLSLRTENPDRSSIVPEFSRANLVYDAIAKMTLAEKVAHGKNTKPLITKINMQLTGKEKAKKERKKTARASEWYSPAPLASTLQNFGQSRRQIIDGANTDATIPQALALLNEEFLNTLQRKSYLSGLLEKRSGFNDQVKLIYQAVLTREPNTEELSLISSYSNSGQKKNAIEDLFWVLVNSQEFKMRP